MDTDSNFLKLLPELLKYTFDFIQPQDVGRLRKTCTFLNSFFSTRYPADFIQKCKDWHLKLIRKPGRCPAKTRDGTLCKNMGKYTNRWKDGLFCSQHVTERSSGPKGQRGRKCIFVLKQGKNKGQLCGKIDCNSYSHGNGIWSSFQRMVDQTKETKK